MGKDKRTREEEETAVGHTNAIVEDPNHKLESEETVPLQRFYFPDIGNGVTIMAASQEEADRKAAGYNRRAEEVPVKEEAGLINE